MEVFYNIINGLAFIMSKSSSTNLSNENKHCLQDKTWTKISILWKHRVCLFSLLRFFDKLFNVTIHFWRCKKTSTIESGDRDKCDPKTVCFQAYYMICWFINYQLYSWSPLTLKVWIYFDKIQEFNAKNCNQTLKSNDKLW